jgi:hypothetical protein
MSLKSLQGAKGKPPATVAQMAAVEFKSVTRLVGMPQVEREKAVRNIVKTVYQAAQIALEIVTKDRGDLVSVVVENYSTLRPLLMDFARAGDDAQVLLELIRSAESRMAVAMVKGNPPEDDGDREPVAT